MPPSIDMATQIQNPPTPGVTFGRTALEQCTTLGRERAALRLRLAMAVASFCRLDGPARLGYASMRDYARNALGLTPVRWLRLRRVGARCIARPSVRELGFSVLDLLAERVTPDVAEKLAPRLKGRSYKQALSIIDAAMDESDSPRESAAALSSLDSLADPEHRPVSFAVPSSVAGYLEETIQLAGAMLGHDSAEADCVEVVAAEASSEIQLTVPADAARRSFGIPADSPPARPRARTPLASPSIPRPSFRRGDGPASLILDRYLRRLLERERGITTQFEDALLVAYEIHAFSAEGFASFAEFGRAALGMAPSTLHDHLARARLRRRKHPIAEAIAAGTLAPAKAQLVERLHRQCHVPASSLGPWIEFAQSHSYRGLFEAVRWAKRQRDTDYRAWSLTDFAPPTRDRIRASKHSISEIATHPTPEILADTALSPTTNVRWVLRRETLDFLLQLMAGSNDQTASRPFTTSHPSKAPPAPPAWWCLLNVFVTARRQWSVIEREPRGIRGEVLRRDDYRCAVPVCSQRRSLEVHHIHFRSAGGEDDAENLVTLCAFHHHALHDGRMRIYGRVDDSAEDLRYELAIDSSGRAGVRYSGEEVQS